MLCEAGWNTDKQEADVGEKKCSFIFSHGGRACVCVGRSGVGRGCSLPGEMQQCRGGAQGHG